MSNYRNTSNYSRNMSYTTPLDIAYKSMDKPYYDEQKNESLSDFPIAMAYVPFQEWKRTYEVDKVLNKGTLFPDLYKPFLGGYRR